MNGEDIKIDQFIALKADIMESVKTGFSNVDKSITGLAAAIDRSTDANSKRFNELFEQDKDRRKEIADLDKGIGESRSYAYQLVTEAKTDMGKMIDGAISDVRKTNDEQAKDITELKTTAAIIDKLKDRSSLWWGIGISAAVGLGAIVIPLLRG